MSAPLALLGGAATWTGGWPDWPQAGPGAIPLIEEAIASGRWAISGDWTGRETLDRRFSRAFAAYLGTRHCLTVDHGSSALVAALLALGVGWGDEVIVPGLTWVACASAVLRVNAVPVLVDICPDTLCMSPAAVEAAITPATAAILVVHLYSAMADMDALRAIAARHGLPIIEDCAQAHGAVWTGRRAGALGAIGAFSMQQGKTLTSGEGGALVTADPELASRLEQLRGDGRRYAASMPAQGHPELVAMPGAQGFNFCLSEMQSALLLDGLTRLDDQNRTRARNATLLDDGLAGVGGFEPIRPHPANEVRAYYHYAVRYHVEDFAGCPVEAVCRALEQELGAWVHPPYRPLNDHPLYRPHNYPPLAGTPLAERLDPRRFPLPEAHRQADRTILLHHAMLLAQPGAIDACVAAFAKVRHHSHALAAWARSR